MARVSYFQKFYVSLVVQIFHIFLGPIYIFKKLFLIYF